ncbi:MAG: hypothetical protein JSS09_07730 [Verrucomicrobia bacterium]|nr:hypothetical protein [Verrucomicrobiota bacterium]
MTITPLNRQINSSWNLRDELQSNPQLSESVKRKLSFFYFTSERREQAALEIAAKILVKDAKSSIPKINFTSLSNTPSSGPICRRITAVIPPNTQERESNAIFTRLTHIQNLCLRTSPGWQSKEWFIDLEREIQALVRANNERSPIVISRQIDPLFPG